MTADRDHDRVAPELAPVRNPDGPCVEEHRRTGTVDEIDPTAPQRVRESLLIVHVVGYAPRAGERRGDVELRTGAAQPESFP